jgi:hypothetical protein
MKKQIILSFMLLLVVFFTSSAQEPENTKVSPEKRDKWIKETATEMRNFKPDSSIKVVTPSILDLGDRKKLAYKVNKSGIINLINDDWIYIITHSSHQDEEIGDVSLAVDNKRHIYINEDHVCGGVIRFETDQITELNKSSDFFKYFVSDTALKGWDKFVF